MAYTGIRQTDLKNDDLTLIHGLLCINAKSLLKVASSPVSSYYFPLTNPRSSQETLNFVRMAYTGIRQTDQKNDDLNLIHGSLCINAKNALKLLFVNVFLYVTY